MKKFLLFFALSALVVGCSDDKDDNNTPTFDSTSFKGTMTITSVKTPSNPAFEAPNVVYKLEKGDDGLYTLLMNEIKFTAEMPMSLNLAIPSLRMTTENGVNVFTSTVDPIVPSMGGKPYDVFKIPEFSCRVEGSTLKVVYVCQNPRIPVGDEPLDHRSSFSGTSVK